jgi:predicted RNA-binding protein (virulence factor B family)
MPCYRLIYQKEIAYFRSARNNVDVVRGEILPAYVQKIRDDGKLDICLRAFGGKQKSLEVSEMIMDHLEWSEVGVLPVGDKSPLEDINREFPGVSKTVSNDPLTV